MDTLLTRLAPLGFGIALLVPLWGCELEDCDPDEDPTCVETDTGTPGTDTTGGGGTTDTTPPPPQTTYRYVWLVDTSASISGSFPGADIDAVEVVRAGRSFFGTAVTDWTTEPGTNNASDVRRIPGSPRAGASGPACAMDATPPHWYSMAGGQVVVDLGAQGAIRDGDTLTIYECVQSGAPGDSFDVFIGTSSRIDAGTWVEVATGASGTATIPIRL